MTLAWMQFIVVAAILFFASNYAILAPKQTNPPQDLFTLGEQHRLDFSKPGEIFGIRVHTSLGGSKTTRYFTKIRLTDGYYVVDAVEPELGFIPKQKITNYYVRGVFEPAGYFKTELTRFLSKFSGDYHACWEWIYCERMHRPRKTLPIESYARPQKLWFTSLGLNPDALCLPQYLLGKARDFNEFHTVYGRYVLYRKEGLDHGSAMSYVETSLYGLNLTSKAYYDAYEKTQTVKWLNQVKKTTGLYPQLT